MPEYVTTKVVDKLPRIPLEGHIDLTYRCNNNCLHCWLWRPANAPEQKDELSFDEIRDIVDQARAMGTRKWGISGGEPMLRPDFPEIFDYITSRSVSYSLNTNGTLITPAIAQQLKRKGNKMIALYGATAETYDKVTRHPGGFEMAMRGFRYMQEAGAGFVVQLIPMKANWHEWEQMKALAESLSKDWRVGATWLYKSAYHDEIKNKEIEEQRIDEIEFDKIIPSSDIRIPNTNVNEKFVDESYLFENCIGRRKSFYIDPFGGMTFCSFVKDPNFIYDLRKGKLQTCWLDFIPSLAKKIPISSDSNNQCFSCQKRLYCNWCAVYSYLENGEYQTSIPTLCKKADIRSSLHLVNDEQNKKYFQIAGLTILLESDLDLTKIKFSRSLRKFEINKPENIDIRFNHKFCIPEINLDEIGEIIYQKVPWKISKSRDRYYYLSNEKYDQSALRKLGVFSADYSNADIYNLNRDIKSVSCYGWDSIALFPTDQIWLSPYLATKMGAIFHSSSVIYNHKGLLFIGHSSAGKTTTIRHFRKALKSGNLQYPYELLCDDRNIVRAVDEQWYVYGTWSHGDISEVSPSGAPLAAIFILEKSTKNEITQISDRKEISRKLLATIIKPLTSTDWWDKELTLIQKLSQSVPFYNMKFDKTGEVITQMAKFVA